jgi:glycosyltransferase involved in cell wall biosynthesis
MSPSPRILDIVNTDHAALHFLAYRVNWINAHTEFTNDIICSDGPHLQRLRCEGARVTTMDIPRGMAPLGIGALVGRLLKHLRANRYDIVHTHNSITGAVGRIAARLARVPVTIHTTHGFHFHEHMTRLQRAPYVAAERVLSRCCDILLCQNREEMGEIGRLGIAPAGGVFHVGNGIDLSEFAPRPAMPQNARPVLLCVGRLEPVKNHGMLFRALQRLRGTHAPVLWCVGEGPLRARYDAELRAMGLADSVQFLGYRYDIPALTAAADVVVLTSIKEGIPRALMQAMAVGVPVVATDVKGTREVVVPGKTGYLVGLEDDAALADRLGQLLASPALRKDMGARAVEHVRRHFDEEAVTKRLVDVYRTALRVPAPVEIEEERPALARANASRRGA